MQTELKHNFIIAGGKGFYETAYSGLSNIKDVKYFNSYIDGMDNKFMQFLARVNFNISINKFIRTPFRNLIYPKIFPTQFDNKKELCYIFFGNQYSVINSSYIKYIKKSDPRIKLVLYMQDIISSLPYYNISEYKSQFDLIISYDKEDCKKYGLTYYPTPFTYIPINFLPNQESFDLYFCGKAKDRFPILVDIIRKCNEKGLKCKFIVNNVPKSERIECDGIEYDRKISYIENLGYVNSSKCILEIMQEHADGFTPRLWEALFYDKHLLTNNSEIKNCLFYNPSQIHDISELGEIYKFINNKVSTSSDIKEQLHPIHLLELVDAMIEC